MQYGIKEASIHPSVVKCKLGFLLRITITGLAMRTAEVVNSLCAL